MLETLFIVTQKFKKTGKLFLMIGAVFFCWFPFSKAHAFDPADLKLFKETGSCSGCNLSGAEIAYDVQRRIDLSYANLKNTTFSYMELFQGNFQGADLRKATFYQIKGNSLNFKNADLRGAILRGINWNNTDLRGAKMDEIGIYKAHLQGMKIQNVSVHDAEWIGVNIVDSNLKGTQFQNNKWIGIDIIDSDFSDSIMVHSTIMGCRIRWSDFTFSKMNNSLIKICSLIRTDMSYANWQQNTIFNLKLNKVTATGLDLSGSQLERIFIADSELNQLKLEKTIFNDLAIKGGTWNNGQTTPPAEITSYGKVPNPIWLLLAIEGNHKEMLQLMTTILPDTHWVMMPAVLMVFLGMLLRYLFRENSSSLSSTFGLPLFSFGLVLFLLTNPAIDFLLTGFLWEVFLLSSICFFGGTLSLFMDKLFGGYCHEKIVKRWKYQAILTILFGVLVIVFSSLDLHDLQLWTVVFELLLFSLFFLSYLLIPIRSIISGLSKDNRDAQIITGSLVFALMFSTPLLFSNEMWSIQTTFLGWLIFGISPGIIILRRNLETNNRLENYASTLEIQSMDLEEKNEELFRLDKLKDEFLANTSHELKTPLNGMIGISDSMLDGVVGELTESQRQQLEMIRSSSRRLSRLLNDLLDFSQMKHHALKLNKLPIDLNSMSQLVLTLLAPLTAHKPVDLLNEIPKDLILVDADENRLQQILHNLIGNALKFTQQGSVVITANHFNEWVKVAIHDTGIGIPKDRQDCVFESFEQADGSTSREFGGTGLGLAITRELVELHGGTIWLESELGKGTSVYFTLSPAKEQTSAEILEMKLRDIIPRISSQVYSETTEAIVIDKSLSTIPDSHPSEKFEFNILAVDDDPVNLQVISNYLNSGNYKTTLALDAVEALELLQDKSEIPFDLILLDVMMPRMTGYEVCQIIRETWPAHLLPVIMLTAKNQQTDLVEGFNIGANDYLTKPVMKNELLARMRAHIQLSKINLAYSRFVPDEFLRLLEKESIVELQLGDHMERNMTILFSDIRSFTSLSESMTPEENFRFINSFLGKMEPSIFKHGGVIDKYIGDAIMALFAEPESAVQAGISMLESLKVYNQMRLKSGYRKVEIGIGINTGNLMLGTIGGPRRMENTVISDAVNLASRTEDLTKVYQTPLLISEHTLSGMKQAEEIPMRYVDRVKVKGKQQQVSVYEVFESDETELRSAKLAVQKYYEQAMKHFQNEEWEDAQRILAVCQQQLPDDKVLQLHLERCQSEGQR